MSNHFKRVNKSVQPLRQRNLTLQTSKYNMKENLQTVGQSHVHAPSLKQYSESPLSTDYNGRKKRDDDYQNWHRTLAQINLQLDNNMNEIIFLLGKRKNLIIQKKKKIKQQIEQRMNKYNGRTIDSSQFQYLNDPEFNKLSSFSSNQQISIKILGKIIQSLPEFKSYSTDEDQKSDKFWNRNRKIQNQIDEMLANLRNIDKNLEVTNNEVIETCRTLDSIEDNLKAMVGNKATENVQKVQPLFAAKDKNYSLLNTKVKQRQVIKDDKIYYVRRIRDALCQLRILRQQRIQQAQQVFGRQNIYQLEKINVKDQGDFTTAFEQLMKLKQKDDYLELSEKEAWNQIENYSKEQDHLYNEILRKQSDQAKAFHNYTKIMNQRIKYSSILRLLGADDENWKILFLDPKQLIRKFKQYKNVLKKFLQQNGLIKQGLIKTNQTAKTFENILRSTQNQKQRRHELLLLLEKCIKRRVQYQHKKQEMRNLMIDQTKNEQERTQYQQQLQTIVSDGNIESYKRIGETLNRCQQEKNRLIRLKNIIDMELQEMDKQVVGLANKIQEEYQDILCQIIPSDCQYSLRNGQDIKKIRNYLRKMYKRLGILKNE